MKDTTPITNLLRSSYISAPQVRWAAFQYEYGAQYSEREIGNRVHCTLRRASGKVERDFDAASADSEQRTRREMIGIILAEPCAENASAEAVIALGKAMRDAIHPPHGDATTLIRSFRCPHCGAAPGQPCRGGSTRGENTPAANHARRVDKMIKLANSAPGYHDIVHDLERFGRRPSVVFTEIRRSPAYRHLVATGLIHGT